jgi:hypothetical protein
MKTPAEAGGSPRKTPEDGGGRPEEDLGVKNARDR